jgi:hypothetical protein
MGVIEQNLNAGSSYYESLNVRLQKRLSKGLSIWFNFMRSKMIDQTNWLNDTDLRPEHRISPFDHPTRVVTAIRSELPGGNAKLVNLRSRWAGSFFGGWIVSTTYTYQAGAPLTWVNGSTSTPGDYVYFGAPLKVQNRNSDGTSFDTSAFNTKAAEQFQYHVRTFSSTFPDIRQDGINDWNVGMLKEFQFGEGKFFRIQGDAFNAINHATFAAANTTATNSRSVPSRRNPTGRACSS